MLFRSGAFILGLTHGRTLLHAYQVRLSPAARGRILGTRDWISWAPLALLTLATGILIFPNLPGDNAGGSILARTALFLGQLLGFWFLGALVIGVVAYIQAIRQTLNQAKDAAPDE